MSTRLKGNANYRRLFWSTGITNLGDGLSAMALPWLATLITRDPLLVALIGFGQRAPWLLFSLHVGVLTDRADRKRLILMADGLRFALTSLIVAMALMLDTHGVLESYWIAPLAALAFLLGTAEVVRDNAAQTILPSIVHNDDLEEANGRLWSVEHVTALIGPPLAGALIALWLPLPFLFDALSFLMALLLVRLVTLAPRPEPARTAVLQEMAQGWHWMRGHPVILRLALMLGCLNFAGMMVMAILVLYAQDVLGLGPLGHGMLLASGAAGGVLAGLIGPRIVARIGGRAAVLAALGLQMSALLAYALVPFALMACLAEATLLFGGVLWNIVTVSYRQRLIPDALLGRVNAIYRFFGWGPLPLAALAGGLLVSTLEPLGREVALRAPFAVSAVFVCLLLLYALRRLHLPESAR
ncbi:MFS transporter [Primorskyibacter sp. S187A]|uniref:MFS transporter n=1 Tax=Primorskyibacter sp. S187A TaxID=3415130 RepID=UPI003C7ADDF4